MKRMVPGAAWFHVGALAISFITGAWITAVPPQQPAPAPPDPARVAAVSRWLADAAIPLKTVLAEQGLEDLAPVAQILKDVRIVGLGEATHGTREFFQFKHRMTEFLVKELGYTVFALEASYAACLNINDYVLYGKGDPAQALASQKFWTWDTEEVRDLIAWMRRYNQTVPEARKVRFLGYDLQHLDQAFEVIPAFLARVAPDQVAVARAAFAPLQPTTGNVAALQRLTDPEKRQLRAGLQSLLAYFALHEAWLAERSSRAEYETALQHTRTLLQLIDSYARPSDDPTKANLRDRYMADNIAHIVHASSPGTRVVVWAHNAHVSYGAYGGDSMGARLREIYGQAYYAIGFAFNQGGFQSRNMDDRSVLTDFTVPAAREGSIEWYLSQSRHPLFFVDLRRAAQGLVADWLRTPAPMRSVGSGFSPKAPERFESATSVGTWYDGLFYIDRTTPARPNPTGRRGPSN
jgi:erythromycin esterase